MQVSVCNNSCWTIGILSKTFKETLSNKTENIILRILDFLCSSKLNKSLAQNASICIGRLGLVNPEVVSKYIQCFLKQFCLSMKMIEESEEKQDAFR
jgi:transportin-1